MPSTFRTLVALSALALATVGVRAQSIYDLPSEGPTVGEIGVDAALDLILAGRVPSPNAEQALIAAGESGDASLVPTLKQIVQAYGEPGSIGFLALSALWDLGEPDQYFLTLAESLGTPDPTAFDAVWVAARRPTGAGLARVQAASDIRAGHLDGAVAEYEDLLLWSQEVQDASLQTAVGLLVPDLARVLTTVLSLDGSVEVARGRPDGDLHPSAVFATSALRDLAAVRPDSVHTYLLLESQRLEYTDRFGAAAAQVAAWFESYAVAEAFPDGLPSGEPPPVDEQADVRPVLECVAANADGTYTAYFGYENRHGEPVTIPRGARNRLTPASYDGQQPTAFPMPNAVPGRPGRTPFYPGHAYAVTFPAGTQVVWTLGRRTSTASDNLAQRCPGP